MSTPTPQLRPRRRLRAVPEFSDDDSVVGVPWDVFMAWFAHVWEQGQHVAIVGPTGCGKTTVALGICKLRNWVLALDAKGGDSTLKGAGFTPVSDWPPPRQVQRDIAEGRPARLVVGFTPRTLAEKAKLKDFLRVVLEAAWVDGHWTVEVDELQLMADRKMMNLSGIVEEFLVAARDKGLSVITAFQAPAWVPTASTRQATWIIIFPTRDETVIKSLAAKVGRDWRELRSILHSLPDHCCVVAGLNPRDPLVLTKPPKVA